MARGKFVWTLSDDDLIVKNVIKMVIRFIIEKEDENVGGMAVKDRSYVVDARTGKKIKYHSSVDNNKPEMYGGISCAEVLQGGVPYRFISALLFNNKLLKKILKEKQDLVKKGLDSYYLHSWLYILLFLLNKKAKYYVLNKDIIVTLDAKPKFKFMLEDHFKLIYKGQIKFFDDLLSIADGSDKNIINAIKKAKGHPNINIIILMIPSSIVKKLCKCILKFKYGTQAQVESAWLETYVTFTYWNKRNGDRRII